MIEETRTVRVWDAFVRVFHWSLVVGFTTAWLFIDDDYETVHRTAGYTVAALVALRIVWGFLGTGYARFAQFVRAPSTVLSYLADIAAAREARYLGHNPAGGAMAVALLAVVSGICLSGWLMTTDAFWGSQAMDTTHEILVNVALGLVVFHVAGGLLASVRHRENLILAMFTGRKRAPDRHDVT